MPYIVTTFERINPYQLHFGKGFNPDSSINN
jgi:hypothetical protein